MYDLQEPFRWLVDLSVIHIFESGLLELYGFCFTGDDYRYRFESEAKQRFIDVLREHFNAGVTYKGRVLKCDTVIEQQAGEFGGFLTGKILKLDFVEPAPKLERQDDREMRAKILSMTVSQAKQLGIEKSTLHYLQQNAKDGQSFKVYEKVRRRFKAAT